MEQQRERLKWVVFTEDIPGKVPLVLMDAFLSHVSARPDMEVAAVYLRKSSRKPGRKKWLHWIRRLMGKSPSQSPLASLIHRRNVPVIHPPENNVNHPELLDTLQGMGATHGFSIYCLQKFSPQLLQCFHSVTNYHNGLLPSYKGVRATSWSIYQGEKETGYTYHLMSPELDKGPILLQGSIPIPESEESISLDLQKASAAAHRMDEMLDCIATGDAGTEQSGQGSYYSRRHLAAIENIGPPGALDSPEILKRLRAFGKLYVLMEKGTIAFKEVRKVSGKTANPCILCKDGVWLEVVK